MGTRLLRISSRGSTTSGLFVVPLFPNSAFSCYSIASAFRQGRLQSARTTLRGLRRKNKNCPTIPTFLHTSKTIDRTLIKVHARGEENQRGNAEAHNFDAVLEWSQRVAHGVVEQVSWFFLWGERTPVVTHRYSVKGYPMTSSHRCVWWVRKEAGFDIAKQKRHVRGGRELSVPAGVTPLRGPQKYLKSTWIDGLALHSTSVRSGLSTACLVDL